MKKTKKKGSTRPLPYVPTPRARWRRALPAALWLYRSWRLVREHAPEMPVLLEGLRSLLEALVDLL